MQYIYLRQIFPKVSLQRCHSYELNLGECIKNVLWAEKTPKIKNPQSLIFLADLFEYCAYCICSLSSSGSNPSVKKANASMECIRHFFPKRKCFVFDRPVNDKQLLSHVDEVLESQLDPKFKEQSNAFCSYIFTHAKPKTLREGITVRWGGKSLALAHVPLWLSVCDELVIALWDSQ